MSIRPSSHPSETVDSSIQCEHSLNHVWLPLPIEFDISRPCRMRTTSKQTDLQLLFLPIYPVLDEYNELFPLLANVPDSQLTIIEKRFRKVHRFEENYDPKLAYTDTQLMLNIREHLQLYARQWHIHATILMFNLNRLHHLIPHITLPDYFIRQKQDSYELSRDDWFTLLEFYLQMDADGFFMKTCSFRGSKPRIHDEGIFARHPPTAHYTMKQCQDRTCRFCYERFDLTQRREPTVVFNKKEPHRFVNNYTVYLNCDVTCTTSNVIYALTCPCHQYDYVGRCKMPFRDRMRHHRMNACRTIRNVFIGKTVADRLQTPDDLHSPMTSTQLKLYRHTKECSATLNMFLTCHPTYWCFVPMTHEQARIDDATLTSCDHSRLAQYEDVSFIDPDMYSYQRDMALVRWCVENIPQPPNQYQFSLRQRIEQYEFFRNQTDQHLSRFLDLYNAAIIIALPENASDTLRHTLQALLIIYAQPKLMIYTTDTEPIGLSDTPPLAWYRNLIHPRLRENMGEH